MRLDFVPQAKAAPIVVPAAIAAVGTIAFAGVLFEIFQQAVQSVDYGRVAQGALEQASYASYEESDHSYELVQQEEGLFKYKVCMEQCVRAMPSVAGKVLCAAVCTVALLAKGS